MQYKINILIINKLHVYFYSLVICSLSHKENSKCIEFMLKYLLSIFDCKLTRFIDDFIIF